METQGAQVVKTPLSRQPKEDGPGFSSTHSPYKAADKVWSFSGSSGFYAIFWGLNVVNYASKTRFSKEKEP